MDSYGCDILVLRGFFFRIYFLFSFHFYLSLFIFLLIRRSVIYGSFDLGYG